MAPLLLLPQAQRRSRLLQQRYVRSRCSLVGTNAEYPDSPNLNFVRPVPHRPTARHDHGCVQQARIQLPRQVHLDTVR